MIYIIVDYSIMWLKFCFIVVLFVVVYGRFFFKGESLENFRVDFLVWICIVFKECF